ncbi:2-succinyl-6-hydroxy-2,4-cyclohexadiene-1-carboxylate synthase [[Haemophilus] ducreyi]|uniref:2-succinyl-6-hydroxy-2, 4-cyclohexadiene-1-carboxylate synthase n=1 Tax=Haemophilus ducreyi TaxID=730 RepID=UPI0006555F48|nr:2-succinyl-6-hydroxy-2,4-cyclohexadiene-1-carboxylate synthase [[Haemophilus] ducreyi]AKO45918.1 2-succinyl-6-hydroxy-2,4-cyclohexadiene-1-carboxylate synthase [[Haemophilus] ducreyi]
MLACQSHNTNTHNQITTPIIFLHGLLGSQADWQAVITLLQKNPQIQPLTIDLPAHGNSNKIISDDFITARQLIDQTIKQQLSHRPFYLVGYSLGGRIALDYALNGNNPDLQHTFLEGTHLGLHLANERQARWQTDQQWATRFRNEPIKQVLQAWYQQPVFADLSAEKRAFLLGKRQHNNGHAIAQMLEATSLAKQPNYLSTVKTQIHRFTFLIGERDHKFRQLATQQQLNYQLIRHAGHNSHQENPSDFVETLLQKITCIT